MTNQLYSASDVQNALKEQSDPKTKETLQRFFKMGAGEYAQGDLFLGVKVPQVRAIAKRFKDIDLDETLQLLVSPIHEERLVALYFLIEGYRKGDEGAKKNIFDIYLAHTHYINNWDLVDTSCEHIVGAYLYERPKELLYELAASGSLWERRIAIISTFYFIKRGEHRVTLEISGRLLDDGHDLIRKAVGWMLREVGKRCGEDILTAYLDDNYDKMSRTTLRYAIEKFDEPKRLAYLRKQPR